MQISISALLHISFNLTVADVKEADSDYFLYILLIKIVISEENLREKKNLWFWMRLSFRKLFNVQIFNQNFSPVCAHLLADCLLLLFHNDESLISML